MTELRDKLACVICLKAEYYGLQKPIECTGNPNCRPRNQVYRDCFELTAADRVLAWLKADGWKSPAEVAELIARNLVECNRLAGEAVEAARVDERRAVGKALKKLDLWLTDDYDERQLQLFVDALLAWQRAGDK